MTHLTKRGLACDEIILGERLYGELDRAVAPHAHKVGRPTGVSQFMGTRFRMNRNLAPDSGVLALRGQVVALIGPADEPDSDQRDFP
jgi:hypothetical protein